MTNFKFFSAWEDFALCRNVCYIHINHTVNKEREVKIWLISKLSTKNGITVSYTANEVWTLKRKMWLKSKRNVAQKSIFLFSPWAPAWRKLMLRVGEANFNGWRMIFKINTLRHTSQQDPLWPTSQNIGNKSKNKQMGPN